MGGGGRGERRKDGKRWGGEGVEWNEVEVVLVLGTVC